MSETGIRRARRRPASSSEPTRTSDEEWVRELAARARDDLLTLDQHEQQRILDELDEIVDSPWRDPLDYGEPLRNSPRRKVRIGEYRLSVTFYPDNRRMVVARTKRRGGAYTADSD
jgi:mRNA-degrading endonuclease RelE of RelBE toxin-antitoxin system